MNRKDSIRHSADLERSCEPGGEVRPESTEVPPSDRKRVPYQKDLLLVERFTAGDKTAALEVLSTCESVMVKAIMRVLTPRRPPEDHEEVLSMAGISLLESVDRFEGRASLKSFAANLAGNEAKKFLTSARRFPLSTRDPDDHEEDDDETGSGGRTAEELVCDKEYFEKCLKKLSDILSMREMMVLELLYVDGLKPEQCAAVLSISRQGVYTTVFQARAKAKSVKSLLDKIET